MSRIGTDLRAAMGRGFSAMPEWAQLVVKPGALGYTRADLRSPLVPPDGDVRLLIAPVNFAGQGHQWARAAQRLPSVGAVNMQYRIPGADFGFPADHAIPVAAFSRSGSWARRHFDIVSSEFTHVLVEAVRPIFGSLFGGSVEREVDALRDAGITVGMILHGSEVRLPSQHMADNPWSPYFEMDAARVASMEERARAARETLRRVDAPIFASTTTLTRIVEGAEWLPVVVDPDQWAAGPVSWSGRTPVAVHVPSSGPMKGTELIEAVARRLEAEGVLEYREERGVPAVEMPGHYRSADIVIDAVRMGNYGVAACEAMAAGRITLCHLNPAAIDEAAKRGIDPPLLRTDPEQLERDLSAIVADPEVALAIAGRGPAYVRAVHDGERSAAVLAPFLVRA